MHKRILLLITFIVIALLVVSYNLFRQKFINYDTRQLTIDSQTPPKIFDSQTPLQIIDSRTSNPIQGAVIQLQTCNTKPICIIPFACDAGGEDCINLKGQSDAGGQVGFHLRSRLKRLYITKDGYHSLFYSDDNIEIDHTLQLAAAQNPRPLPTVRNKVFFDAPGNPQYKNWKATYGLTDNKIYIPSNTQPETRETMYGITGNKLYITNNYPEGTSTYKATVALPVSEATDTQAPKIELVLNIENNDLEKIQMTIRDGNIESHGNNLYLFNTQRSVNPKSKSAMLHGRTVYTFSTSQGIFGKIYIFGTTIYRGNGTSPGVIVDIDYVASRQNELELNYIFDGVSMQSDETVSNLFN